MNFEAKVKHRTTSGTMQLFESMLYKNVPVYVSGVSEEIFKVVMYLPGSYVCNDDVRYIFGMY